MDKHNHVDNVEGVHSHQDHSHVDHSNMKHSDMDHSHMDHGSMEGHHHHHHGDFKQILLPKSA